MKISTEIISLSKLNKRKPFKNIIWRDATEEEKKKAFNVISKIRN